MKLSVIFRVVSLVLFTSYAAGKPLSVNNIFQLRNAVTYSQQFNLDLVKTLELATRMAKKHCQSVFKWNKWNCPDSTFESKYKHPVTKEHGYARAIISAAMVHTLTRNCSKGDIEGCGCDPKFGHEIPLNIPGREILSTDDSNEKVEWSWGGCSDNVEFSSQITSQYLRENEIQNDPKSFVHMHNDLIGREIVRKTMVKRCRCHGVSGSCTVRTCWMQVSPFEAVAKALKTKYQSAAALKIDKELSNSAIEVLPYRQLNIPRNSLIYLETSPDYCQSNSTFGWKGTKGRTCSRSKLQSASPSERRSCRNICKECGHRVRKEKKIVQVRCKCSFKWCCSVECETCSENVEEFYCD